MSIGNENLTYILKEIDIEYFIIMLIKLLMWMYASSEGWIWGLDQVRGGCGGLFEEQRDLVSCGTLTPILVKCGSLNPTFVKSGIFLTSTKLFWSTSKIS